jgi:hypothetical protein
MTVAKTLRRASSLIAAVALAGLAAPSALADPPALRQSTAPPDLVERYVTSERAADVGIPDVVDRAVARGLGATPVRPDDRSGSRRPIATVERSLIAVPSEGFDWGDATIGAGAMFAALLLAGALAMSIRRHRLAIRKLIPIGLALAVPAIAVFGVATAGASSPDEIQAAEAAASRYHSFTLAEKDGYSIVGEPCVQEAPGTMGIHAANQALIADPAIDPRRPEILLYLPKENGKLELIGVEYMQTDADGNLATDDDRPSIFGQPFDGPMPGHSPGMPVHYDLHVWLYADNPSGLFAQFNPSLSC